MIKFWGGRDLETGSKKILHMICLLFLVNTFAGR